MLRISFGGDAYEERTTGREGGLLTELERLANIQPRPRGSSSAISFDVETNAIVSW
jgi:hypothetical protein